MDEGAQEGISPKLDYDYMKSQLAHNDTYTFIVEMRDMTGATRVKRFRVFLSAGSWSGYAWPAPM